MEEEGRRRECAGKQEDAEDTNTNRATNEAEGTGEETKYPTRLDKRVGYDRMMATRTVNSCVVGTLTPLQQLAKDAPPDACRSMELLLRSVGVSVSCGCLIPPLLGVFGMLCVAAACGLGCSCTCATWLGVAVLFCVCVCVCVC